MDSGLKLWGIMTASAIVLSNNSPTLVKAAARLAKVVFHDRIQICEGVNDNVEIQAALDALPATGGEVHLLDGTYSLSAPLVMDSYQTLRGCGRSTIIVNGTVGAFNYITAVGGLGTEKVGLKVADLCCDGSISGTADIAIDWTFVDYSQVHGCWLINMANFGMGMVTSDWNNIVGNIFEHCNWDGIYVSESCFNDITGNVVEDIYGGNPISMVFVSTYNNIAGNVFTGVAGAGGGPYLNNSPYNSIVSNIIEGYVDGNGIEVSGSSKLCTITGNTISNCMEGMEINGTSDSCVITGNVSTLNIYDGLLLRTSYNSIVGNNFSENGDEGMYVTGAHHNLIAGNVCQANSQTTDVAEDNILLTASDYNFITGNFIRRGTLANKPRYGINISNATCDKNTVIGNDLYDGGTTAPFNDAGTLTTVEDDNRGIEITQIKHFRTVTNTSGSAMAVGEVVSLKAVAAGNEVVDPAGIGERQVYGMVAEIIADTASGLVQTKGKTTVLLATNVGGGAIVIGDFLITEAGVRARKCAAITDPIFARALEDLDAVDGVIDAFIMSPWD